jgi:glucose/arabinose dehydrogenase
MPRPLRLTLIAVLALAAIGLGVALVARDDDTADDPFACAGEPLATPTTIAPPDAPPAVTATRVAEVEAPTDLAVREGDDAIYVAARAGQIYRVEPGGRPEQVFEVEVTLEKEQGLLSIAFDPEGAHLYVSHTDTDGVSRVTAHPVAADGAVGEGSEILSRENPRANHNVDELVFGPDGHLYISAGDGGVDLDDDGQEIGDPHRWAQDLDNWYGKILRIEPDPAGGYTVPPDNPYVDTDGAAPEVWMSGMRNPWRFSFDSAGDVWIGDVGQYCAEEINHLAADDAAGADLGWSDLEGFRPFYGDGEQGDTVLPLYAYQRHEATDTEPPECAVIGGHVYRGTAIPELDGDYVFGDFCSGEVRALRRDDSGAVAVYDLVGGLPGLQSLAEDLDGELYALAADGAYRLDPAG